ncbi:MAG: hypothetical protein RBG13Loki_2358 [Promethearchaeota archaeon CR_4]|nr:MAG: hypothetical protein RBG13Loki_2358 [Candidatus Lokiarchaeota archaeon CR_4]
MGKGIAIVGGLIAILLPILGYYVAFLGMWYSATSLGDSYGWIDVLGYYHVTSFDVTVVADDAIQLVLILGIITLIGGAVVIFGGLAEKKSVVGVGVILILVGAVIFAVLLPSILDDNPIAYVSNISLYFAVEEGILEVTQLLGGGFWGAIIGAVIGLMGMTQLRK